MSDKGAGKTSPEFVARQKAWSAVDPNGNGDVSLAEFDGWIKKVLVDTYRDVEGKRLWEAFRPSYIRSFNVAKSAAQGHPIKGTSASTDDYVTKQEFRVLLTCLCNYAVMDDCFVLVDGGGQGVTDTDDRRVSLEEWTKAFDQVKQYGFKSFSRSASAADVFKKMDADGKGMVLLNEFCDYVAAGEDGHLALFPMIKPALGARRSPSTGGFQPAPRSPGRPGPAAREARPHTAPAAVPHTGPTYSPKVVLAPGATEDLKSFVKCFSGMAAKDGGSSPAFQARTKAWHAADPNGNGFLSLAETDKWIRDVTEDKLGEGEGKRIWELFRPSYIRAFNAANGLAPAKKLTKRASTDDYVSWSEFRVLIACICNYATMDDAFALIDGGGAGVSDDDDRRLSLQEWTAAYPKMKGYAFTAFANSLSADAVFKQMDSDGKGMVLLKEFCDFIHKGELQQDHGDTERGQKTAPANPKHSPIHPSDAQHHEDLMNVLAAHGVKVPHEAKQDLVKWKTGRA
jgi:hypothetical protein